MTPIFKRFLKRGMLTAVFMLLIATLNILSNSSELSASIRSITNTVTANNITAESFKTKHDAEKTAMLLQSDPYSGGYATDLNTYDIIIPSVLPFVEDIKTKTLDFSFGMGVALAISCAAAAFSDERGRKKQSFINALPYKRSRLFFERTLSGILSVCFFFIVTYIMLALYIRHYIPTVRFLGERLCMDAEYMQRTEHLKEIGYHMLLNALYALLFFAVILFAQTLFGQTAYACILAVGLLLCAGWAVNGISDICGIYDASLFDKIKLGLLNFFRYSDSDRLLLPLIISAFTAVFIAAAYISDMHTRLERVGELFIYKPLKYIVIAVFAVEGAFTFFHFIYWICCIRPETFLSITGILAVGAALTVLMFNKLILRGEY